MFLCCCCCSCGIFLFLFVCLFQITELNSVIEIIILQWFLLARFWTTGTGNGKQLSVSREPKVCCPHRASVCLASTINFIRLEGGRAGWRACRANCQWPCCTPVPQDLHEASGLDGLIVAALIGSSQQSRQTVVWLPPLPFDSTHFNYLEFKLAFKWLT